VAAERVLTTPAAFEAQYGRGPHASVPTGNECLAVPDVGRDGSIGSINVLSWAGRGLLSVGGRPLLAPLVLGAAPHPGDPQELQVVSATHPHPGDDWTCRTLLAGPGFQLTVSTVVPPGCKGLAYHLALRADTHQRLCLRVGVRLHLLSPEFIIFSPRPTGGRWSVRYSEWTASLVAESVAGLPLLALALTSDRGCPEPETVSAVQATPPAGAGRDSPGPAPAGREMGACLSLSEPVTIQPGGGAGLTFYLAVNLEADGAATTAVHLRRLGWSRLLDGTRRRLGQLTRRTDAVATGASAGEDVRRLMRRNLLFNHYFAQGLTLDGEHPAAVTSRSPRYYVSAAFWPRDSLFWSLPALQLSDPDLARRLLLIAYQRHLRHPGEHSQYIDGTVLYPGFELDQLAAFPIALARYLRETGDASVLAASGPVLPELDRLTACLEGRCSPPGLYATELDPCDDPVTLPFLTYDNVLAWRAWRDLALVLRLGGRPRRARDCLRRAAELAGAVNRHCICAADDGRVYAWATDGNGRHELGDRPAGSLQLLPWWGFCAADDPVYRRTVAFLRSPRYRHYHRTSHYDALGCEHAEGPWVMDALNRLLAGDSGGLDMLVTARLDQGIACETVSPATGEVCTGAAFATCAGYLAWAVAAYLTGSRTMVEFCRRRRRAWRMDPEKTVTRGE